MQRRVRMSPFIPLLCLSQEALLTVPQSAEGILTETFAKKKERLRVRGEGCGARCESEKITVFLRGLWGTMTLDRSDLGQIALPNVPRGTIG
jgi:hypothetical protein